MHHFVRAADIKPTTAFPKPRHWLPPFRAFRPRVGAVHSGWGLCELDARRPRRPALQSFEKSFFVLAGHPMLILDGRGFRLSPGACGLIPVGMQHAWLGPTTGTARWIDMNAPCPKGENFADDTYFLGLAAEGCHRATRHPRSVCRGTCSGWPRTTSRSIPSARA